MIALIAGTGEVPGVVAARLVAKGEVPVVCTMPGYPADVPGHLPRLDFRLETLGSLLITLRLRGVTRLCLVGAMRRPPVDPAMIDAATAPLIPRLMAAMGKGDDGTLRTVVTLLESEGFTVVGAAEIAPDLLLPAGVPTRAAPGPDDLAQIPLGLARIAAMGHADSGQACVIRGGEVIAEEGPEGTDVLLETLPQGQGGFLFKAPKPGQELRVDMPVIGPQTAMLAAQAGLSGIMIAGGTVMVVDPDQTVQILDGMGMYLLVRDPE